MKKTYARDLTVGAVVLLAAFIFTIGVFSIGSEQRIWVSKVKYKLRIPEANGLQNGSPVRLAGVQVGTVTDVHFSDDSDETTIVVDLAVDERHQHRIRRDTVADVKILTLLGGEKYIELKPGTPSEPILQPGDYITVPQSFGFEQLGELSANISDDIQNISKSVRFILDTIQKQEGVVGRMLLDPNFGQEVFSDVGRSATLMRQTMEEIHAGRGLVGRMVNDDEYGRQTSESIRTSLNNIETILAKMTAEGGVLDRAVDPNGAMATALSDVQEAASNLRDFTADLKEGHGTVGKLVSDEQYAAEVLENVKEISRNLADITEKLNTGEGTLGALINDPQLHDDLMNVVRGVQKSKMITGLIRHYRKKGEKEQAREQERLRKENLRDDVIGVEPQGGE